MDLQRRIGNQAVSRLLADGVAAKQSTNGGNSAQESDVIQRVYAPEFIMDSIVRHHFPNGGAGYQTSQTAEKMRREVQENGAGGQDTGFGYKDKPLYHKSSGVAGLTSVSAIFTVRPTYVVAMGEHSTDTSYTLYWLNRDVTFWNVNNTVGLNNGTRIDVASKADLLQGLSNQGYPTQIARVGGQLSWGGGQAQANRFTMKKAVKCGASNTTLYCIQGEGIKGVWERTSDQKDTIIANGFQKG